MRGETNFIKNKSLYMFMRSDDWWYTENVANRNILQEKDKRGYDV